MEAGGTKLSESAIQSQIVTYLAALGIDAVAVPNGSHIAGSAQQRARKVNAMKRTGMLPGFPDLVCFDRKARRVALIEVKSEGGRLQESQKKFAAFYVPVWGWPYSVCRSVEDVRESLHEWGWRPMPKADPTRVPPSAEITADMGVEGK